MPTKDMINVTLLYLFHEKVSAKQLIANMLFMEDVELAYNILSVAKKMDPNDPFTHFIFGKINKKQGWLDASTKDFEKAKELFKELHGSKKSPHMNHISQLFVAITEFYNKNYAQAISILEEIIPFLKNKYVALYYLAISYKGNNNRQKAISTAKKLIELDSFHYIGYYTLGNYYYLEKEYQKAEEFLTQAVKNNPTDLLSWDVLGRLYDDLLFFIKATNCYKKSLAIFPGNSKVWHLLGNTLIKAGKLDEALKSQYRALELKPNDPAILGNIGKIYVDMRDYPNARKFLERAQSIKENYEILINLGNVCIGEKNPDGAISIYEKALAKNPNDLLVINNLATAYVIKKDYPNARKYITPLLEKDPKNIRAYDMLGKIAVEEGDLDAALEEYNKGLAINPMDPLICLNLGKLYMEKLSDFSNAKKYFEFAFDLMPVYQIFIATQIIAYEIADINKEKEKIRKELKANPENIELLTKLGIILLYSGSNEETEEGNKIIGKALALQPKTLQLNVIQGYIQIAQNDGEEARKFFEKALKIQPDYVLAQHMIGDTLYRENKIDEAMGYLEKALVMNPEFIATFGKFIEIYSQQNETEKLKELGMRFQEVITKRLKLMEN